MLKGRNIRKRLLLIFLICFLFSSTASATSELNDFKSNNISDSSIKEFANDSSFIAYRGTLPKTIDQKWENSIGDCWLNLTRMGPSYSKFDRSIKNIAYNNEMLIIEIRSAYKGEVNNSRIDVIYQKIEDYCEQQEGISDVPVVFIWAHDEEDLSLPDYGPQIFEKVKNESGFITTRGIMPVITDANEKVEWVNLLTEYSRSSSFPKGISPYLAVSGGPINGFGADINGYLLVGFEPSAPEKVNESVINKIYNVIDEHFEQKGINDVPVVFEWIEVVNDTLALANEPDANEINDINLSDNKEEVVSNKATNQISGFTSIIGVLGILSLLIIKRSA